MSEQSRVLVLGGTPRTVIAVSRSLRDRGIPAICAGFDRPGLSLHSNAVAADLALSGLAGGFFEELKRVVAAHRVDTIVPCSDRALELLLPYYGRLQGIARLACPPPEVIVRVLDKSVTLKMARACGVRVPHTYFAGTVRDFAARRQILRFPIVAKPLYAGRAAPFKAHYVGSSRELEALADAHGSCECVFQEYVFGDGVGISTIVADGIPLVLFQHRRLHEYPPGGGVGVWLESEAIDPTLARAATDLLERLEWRGVAMVEFRHNRTTREYALMEVNGRFWGSLPLATRAGIDFPYLQWQVSHGLAPDVPRSYRVGVKVRWSAGELQRFADLVTSRQERHSLGYHWTAPFLQLAQAFAPGTRSALFSIRDPLPEMIDVAATGARVLAAKSWRVIRDRLPAPLARRIAQLRLLASADRKTYLFRWLAQTFAPQRAAGGHRLDGARRILVVCRANRIRSPLAAAMLVSAVGDAANRIAVRSAGTRATPEGSFDTRAQAAAHRLGLRMTGRPEALTGDLVASSEIVLAMDRIVEAEILTRFPQSARKVFLPGDLIGAGVGRDDEVCDPDTASSPEFDRFVSRLAALTRLMADRLGPARDRPPCQRVENVSR